MRKIKILSLLLGLISGCLLCACSTEIDVNDPHNYCWEIYDAAQSHPVNRYEWCTGEEVLQKIDFYNTHQPQPADYHARKTRTDSQQECERNNFYE